LNCLKTFVCKKKKLRSADGFDDFHCLITGEVNRKNILRSKQVSRKTLSVKFKVFFDRFVSSLVVWRVLPPTLTQTNSPWVLAIDGKWLRRAGVVMIYRDITHSENIFWSYHSSESAEAINTDLNILTILLEIHQPSGVISDWKNSIVSGVDNYFDHVPHQRCLAHVVREAKRYLPKTSSFSAVLVLREIAKDLPYVKTRKEATKWKTKLIDWEKAYGLLLKERSFSPTEQTKTGPKWWYTHGNLRRAWRLISSNWYPFFVHLDHPLIPNTNNSLEGVNCQLKNKLLNHRGMKTLQQVSFLFWYLTFTRTKTKQDMKKLWDEWKTQKSSEKATVNVT
jgi:Transposase, Mutator family